VKQSLFCDLVSNTVINEEIFRMDFAWEGKAPKAGQFFLVRPERSSFFLGRPISVARREDGKISFLVARRGKGTAELAEIKPGERAELTGPLGNAWLDAIPEGALNNGSANIALVGGGIGLAPLMALGDELPRNSFDVYAGFKTGFSGDGEREQLLGPLLHNSNRFILATEDGSEGEKGRIPDFFDPSPYAFVFACGPEPMLKAVAARCKASGKNTNCFISMEKRMACGVGACLGCTVKTRAGNRRCCADGPIFNAAELVFDE
jgi:NAD(P)H-flavin reductase